MLTLPFLIFRKLPEPDKNHSSTDEEWFFAPLTLVIDLSPFFLKKDINFKIENVAQNSRKRKSAYETFHPNFKEAMDKAHISDESTKSLVQSKASEMRVAVRSKLKSGAVISSSSGLFSLPSFEKCSVLTSS